MIRRRTVKFTVISEYKSLKFKRILIAHRKPNCCGQHHWGDHEGGADIWILLYGPIQNAHDIFRLTLRFA